MNANAYEAQLFAKKYYARLINTRHAINNKSPYKSKVPYSSRNTTHMAKYQQQLKAKKLVDKLLEIHTSYIEEKPKCNKNKQKKKKSKRKLSLKNRKLSFSENKSFSLYSKTLINPFKFQQTTNCIHIQNCNMVDKLTDIKSNYSKQIINLRQKKLIRYNKILKKSKKQQQIRDQFFDCFQMQRKTSRPSSGNKNNNKLRLLSATTRPQTAKQI